MSSGRHRCGGADWILRGNLVVHAGCRKTPTRHPPAADWSRRQQGHEHRAVPPARRPPRCSAAPRNDVQWRLRRRPPTFAAPPTSVSSPSWGTAPDRPRAGTGPNACAAPADPAAVVAALVAQSRHVGPCEPRTVRRARRSACEPFHRTAVRPNHGASVVVAIAATRPFAAVPGCRGARRRQRESPAAMGAAAAISAATTSARSGSARNSSIVEVAADWPPVRGGRCNPDERNPRIRSARERRRRLAPRSQSAADPGGRTGSGATRREISCGERAAWFPRSTIRLPSMTRSGRRCDRGQSMRAITEVRPRRAVARASWNRGLDWSQEVGGRPHPDHDRWRLPAAGERSPGAVVRRPTGDSRGRRPRCRARRAGLDQGRSGARGPQRPAARRRGGEGAGWRMLS